jgi:hypothetical protein
VPDRDDMTGGGFRADLLRELRRPPNFGAAPRMRVMDAVRREKARPGFAFIRRWNGERPGWISPALGTSLAAGLLLFTAVGSQLELRRDSGASVSSGAISAAIRDTMMLVRFALHAPGAGSVALVGDFNSWRRDSILMRPVGPGGAWVASVPLARGEHRYAFVVDDTAWVLDPESRAFSSSGRVSTRLIVPTP